MRGQVAWCRIRDQAPKVGVVRHERLDEVEDEVVAYENVDVVPEEV